MSTVTSEVKVVDRGSDPRTIPTDVAIAAEARSELMPHMEAACVIFNRVRSYGLIASFNIGPDQYGRVKINSIDIVRPL